MTKSKSQKPKEIEYYTINSKILPVAADPDKQYDNIINSWFKKGYRIRVDSSYDYFTLTQLAGSEFKGHPIYYGVISKFVDFNQIDFVDNEGNLIEYKLPDNVKARAQQYEFIFMPRVHRFAFVKVGKIDPDITKKGAPLKKITKIIEKAFEELAPKDSEIKVIIEQDSWIFNEIYSNKVLTLNYKISYTNDDHLSDEHKKFMDHMLKEAEISEMNGILKSHKGSSIDTSKEFPGGIISLSKENGELNALIEDENGHKKRLSTREYPEVNTERTTNNNPIVGFLTSIADKFLKRYR